MLIKYLLLANALSVLLLHANNCCKHFTYIRDFIHKTKLRARYSFPHFVNEKIKEQRVLVSH